MKVNSLLCLAAAATLVSAGQFIPTGKRPDINFIPGAFIVEFLDDFDLANSGISLNVKIGLSFDIRQKFNIFNGVSIKVKSDHTGDDLAAMEGVKRVWPVELVQLPTPEFSKENLAQPFLTSAHKMTGVDYVQQKFKYTGEGIRVGIIDTGVDYKHPALGGCFGKGCRVEFGWDFLGDKYEQTSIPAGDDDPMDECNGHGTHVAGIVGADARKVGAPQPFVGVAPKVTFGAYRVLSCYGGGSVDIIMKGMEKAAEDKMNIINMSLGGGSDYRTNPVAVLADKLAKERGLVLVAAAGNDGADGIWSVSDCGLGATSTSAASFDNIASDYYYFSLNGVNYPYLSSKIWGKPLDLPPSATFAPSLKSDGSLSDGCTAESYVGHNVSGKVVIVYGDSTCTSDVRGSAAQAAGAAGMLSRSVPFGLAPLNGISGFPIASIEAHVGDQILAVYKASPTIKWSKEMKSFSTEGAGTPSSFSSWGFDGDLHIKPDISAPGGKILSTFPRKMGGYHVASGTSMASPYVAGAYALLFDKSGKLPAQDVRQRFLNAAVPGHFFNHTKPAPVAKQGGGLINVKNAITSKTFIVSDKSSTPDRIELLDSVHFAGKSVNVKIKNTGDHDAVYDLSHEPAESAISYRGGNTFPLTTPLLEDDEAIVTFSMSNVTVRAGKSVKIKVQFQEPSTGRASEFPYYSGYIVATPRTQDASPARLPYAGIKGDISQVPILDTKSGFPSLTIYNSTSGESAPAKNGHKIDWNVEQPQIHTRLGSHTPELSFRLHDYGTDRLVGYLDTLSGIGASSNGRDRDIFPNGQPVFETTDWIDGQIYTDRDGKEATTAGAGKYKVVVAAQRKLSKGAYPKDFEVYEVAVITL